MATSRTVEGPTPNGGVRAEIRFRDEAGDPADEAVATRAEVVEYDAAGREVARTYADLTPGDPG